VLVLLLLPRRGERAASVFTLKLKVEATCMYVTSQMKPVSLRFQCQRPRRAYVWMSLYLNKGSLIYEVSVRQCTLFIKLSLTGVINYRREMVAFTPLTNSSRMLPKRTNKIYIKYIILRKLIHEKLCINFKSMAFKIWLCRNILEKQSEFIPSHKLLGRCITQNFTAFV